MSKSRLDILRLFNPATDSLAIIAVVLGLFIAIFLDEVAIKLIGVCIAILGSVALFMLFSQRIKDTSFLHTAKPVSETTAFKTTVRQDTGTKRLIFDDYADSFGKDDFSNNPKAEESPDAPAPYKPSDADSSDEGFTILPKNGKKTTEQPSTPPSPVVPEKSISLDLEGIEDFSDGSSSMRILGSVKKSPKEAVPAKQESPKQESPKQEPVQQEQAKPKEEVKKATPQKEQPTQAVQAKLQQEKTPVAPPKKQVQEQPVVVAEPQKNVAPVAPIVPPSQEAKLEVAQQPQAQPVEKQTEVAPRTTQMEETPPPVLSPSASSEAERATSGPKRKTVNIQLTDIIIEETPNTIKNEPRKEFDFLISRVLMVIRSVISARTTLFFWVNFDKQELVLESKISDSQDAISTRRKMPLANDVISQIALSGTPEILTEINPSAEMDLLPYYRESAATRSFVGVPVYFNNNVVGILTADTTEEDAYDSVTVSFLGHFTKLISGLIQGYTDKYDLLQSARTLEVVDTFRRLVSMSNISKEDVCTALMESLDDFISYSALGICIYSEESDCWYVEQMRSTDGTNYTDKRVILDTTLIGRTITTGTTAQYSTASLPQGMHRITASEQPLRDAIATFIPLKSPSRCYGAIFAEMPATTPLTQQDLEVIEVLSEYAGATLEHKHLTTVIRSNALTDEATGILNSVAFLNRVQEEFYRSSDLRSPFALCLINIDQYASLHSGNDASIVELIAQHTVEHIEQHLRPYDIIGRVDANILGVALIHKNGREAQLWAERVRGDIASALLQYHGRQFSVTVSTGVVEYTSQKSFDELLSNAEQALQAAARKTNAVSLYA